MGALFSTPTSRGKYKVNQKLIFDQYRRKGHTLNLEAILMKDFLLQQLWKSEM